jgi:ribosomal protein S18 acetylase RimI-like enzyme
MKSEDISVRPLAAEDEPLLWIMLYLAIFVPENEPRPAFNIIFRPDLAKYARDWGRPGDSGCAACDAEGLPVGAAWLRLLTGANRGYGWVNDRTPEISIAVLPEYRGLGIGARLMTAALEQARGLYPAVSLSVSKANPAVALYRRLGFQAVQESEESSTMLLDL